MLTTLCEKCFQNPDKDGNEYEVKSIVPLTPCMVCGVRDQRMENGIKVRLYGGDPRDCKQLQEAKK